MPKHEAKTFFDTILGTVGDLGPVNDSKRNPYYWIKQKSLLMAILRVL